MLALRAARILTMNPECPELVDGGILVQDGRIVSVVPWREAAGAENCRDLGPVTLVPGLINAHMHLELSHLAGRIPSGRGFAAWADSLYAAMRSARPAQKDLERALSLARAGGTCFVADVGGREPSMVRGALAATGVGGHLFRELAGRGAMPDWDQDEWPGPWSPSVHALYSASPELARGAKNWCGKRGLPFSLHVAEVPGENDMFLGRGGDFADFLGLRRILPKGFVPPGLSAVAYANALGLLDGRTLAVHCVHAGREDIDVLAASGAGVCLCPRSNRTIGVGAAPAAAMYAAGVPLCLGTDSLASNTDLDLWEEVRVVRAMLPADTPIGDILAMVTRNSARVMGIESDYGRLEAGRIAVFATLPRDLEEPA